MTIIAVLIRCTIGCVIGSSPGLAMIAAGRIEQGIGLAIIGGLLGMVLAISSVLYKTTASETFSRGLLLFLQMTAAKNIPGGERLVHIEDKDIPARHGQNADPVALHNRMHSGMKLGMAVATLPAILIAIYIRDANPDPEPVVLQIMKKSLIGFAFVTIVGGGFGTALGSLSVPGVHRRNIALGTFVGLMMGAGIASAVVPGARIPTWHLFGFCCGLFGCLGMAAGMFAGDNFR